MTTRMIAHYEIRDLLGEGGIGQVHAAHDTVLGREVAIKSLRPELLNDSSFVERCRTEATNLARLNHPNITTLYTLLPDGGNLYMVMELVRGRTLEQIITERGTPFGSAEAVAVIGQAADGLSYAHQMGVVHRDIKPANLIITDSGLLKIMDFGIARVQGSQRHTRDGSVVGTLAYMAPEQLRAEEVDARTDLYSLAIVLYEMLTGAVPFSETNDYDLMRAQIHTAPERPTKAVPGIDPQVERALMRALSKKAGDRYASVEEFKQALGSSVSRTEALSIAHKVTRLATAVKLPPALTTAIAEPARKFSPALRGVAIGAAAAVVVAGVVVLLLGPRSTSQTAAVPIAAPPPVVQQTTATPKSPPAPTAAAHPMFPATRPSQTAASPPPPPPPAIGWKSPPFPGSR
jgi:eukaryotic-like serine/threonine-protein kinase